MANLNEKILNADSYLESLYAQKEACDLVLQNSQVFGSERVQKAEKTLAETQENIEKRLKILKNEGR